MFPLETTEEIRKIFFIFFYNIPILHIFCKICLSIYIII